MLKILEIFIFSRIKWKEYKNIIDLLERICSVHRMLIHYHYKFRKKKQIGNLADICFQIYCIMLPISIPKFIAL